MSTWRGLGSIVRELHALRVDVPQTKDPRDRAAALASRLWGQEMVLDMPAMLNVAMLALTMERLSVHELRGRVPAVIDGTDLHSLPDEPPRLLRQPWIVEVRNPGPEALFENDGERCCALGGYELDGTRYLIGLGYPDGIRVVRWRPQWRGGELDAGIVTERDTSLLEGIDATEHAEWGAQAARFATVLGLLLDAEGSPLASADEGPSIARTVKGKPQPARPWAVRRIYLVERPGEGGVGSGSDALDEATNRLAAEVRVSGHLKRQRYGEGRALVKWIYVAGYEARRWVSPQPKRVIVT